MAPSSGLPGGLFALATRTLLACAFVAVSLLAGGRPVAEVAVYVVDGPLVAALRGGDGVDDVYSDLADWATARKERDHYERARQQRTGGEREQASG